MVLIKCCDISNEVRPMEVSDPWVDCLLEEYFNQVRLLNIFFILIANIIIINTYSFTLLNVVLF